MSVKITDRTKEVQGDITQKASIFLRTMADTIVSISQPVTPKKTGRLRMDVLRQVLGLKGKVAWQKNYAAIQETKQFAHYTTAGTGSKFAEKGVKGGVERTADVARKVGLI